MTIMKAEVIQAQATTLSGCCQSDNISTDCGSSMEDLDNSSNRSTTRGNNNVLYHQDSLLDSGKYCFPKRDPVDVEFKDLRFTASKFNISKFKFGKYTFFIFFLCNFSHGLWLSLEVKAYRIAMSKSFLFLLGNN